MRPVHRHDVRLPGGLHRVRRLGLLAILLALVVPTATAITTTSVRAAAVTSDAGAVTLAHAVGGSAVPACDVPREGSDTGVRVVRKVRGVFLPHGLVPPVFEPADVTRPQQEPPAYTPTWHATVPTDVHPRRGPPGVSVFSSP